MIGTRTAIRWMLWREFLDQRQNRMLWPVYLLMPLIGTALPALLSVGSAALLSDRAPLDPSLQSMLIAVRMLAGSAGIDLNAAAAIVMLRMAAGYFLLMPLAIVSISGAYGIVGEKQQRTLEPLLASPLSTADFLLAKLVAVTLPSVLITWVAATVGAAVSVLAFYWSHGLLIWPDVYYWLAVLLLSPLIALITALVCLRISARMQDPQAANQVTALILIPLLLLLFAVAGPALMYSLPVLLAAAALLVLIVAALFWWVRRSFNREEILCRWR